MAVFHVKCANTEVRIHDRDHDPPHCHVRIDGRDVRVRLENLQVFWSTHELPAKVRKCLRKHQDAMLRAWERVTVTPIPPRV
jgi:hypothetical protein